MRRLRLSLAMLLACGGALAGDVGIHRAPAEEVPAKVRGALGGEELRINGDNGCVGCKEPSIPKPEDVRGADLALVTAATSPEACKLRELVVNAPVSVVGAGALQAPCFASLETLDLRSIAFDDAAARLVAGAPFAPTLRVLGIGSGVGPLALQRLLHAMPAIEELSIRDVLSVGRASAITAEARPKLRTLAFACPEASVGPDVLDPVLTHIGAARTLPALESLSICHAKPGPHTIDTLVRSGLGARLQLLAGVMISDRAQAIDLATRAPGIRNVDFASAEVRSAWSTTRAARILRDGRLPGDLTIAGGDGAHTVAGVEVIEGRLVLHGPVGDLAGLGQLTEVTGDLEITGKISDISVLSRLRHIGGTLRIEGTELVGLDGLSALEVVDGSVSIHANEHLRSTRGLARLRTVGRSLTLPAHMTGNPRLAEVAFPALATVGKELCIATGPAFLRDKDDCWCADGPESTHVLAVRFRRFASLVSAGRCSWGEDQDLVAARPSLFPEIAGR